MPLDQFPDATLPANSRKSLTGVLSNLKGASAEDQVARRYEREGAEVINRRWRGQSGELDLVLRKDADIICVEVKSSSTHAKALQNLTARQRHRIYATAEEFLGTQPLGQLTPLRLDVATVDGTGSVEILENALGAY